MAEPSVARRTKRWTGARAVRYRWHERWGDRRCGTRDARSRLAPTPAPPEAATVRPPEMALTAGEAPPSESVWATPTILSLGQLGRARAERAWIAYQAETAELQVSRTESAARSTIMRDRALAAQRRLDELVERPDVDENAVVAGEEKAEESVRVGRRRRAHAAAVQAAREEIRDCTSSAEQAELESTRIADRIRIRREVAEVQVAMIEAYVRRRCSTYLAHLVRKHPDGARIGPLLRAGWSERPSWLSRGDT